MSEPPSRSILLHLQEHLQTTVKVMDTNNENQENLDINVDSLWIVGPRAKGGKRENNYHGNFVPQIPEQMIRRYAKNGGVVLDMFMGSGTTLFEAETLGNPYIGFDINDEIIANVQKKMESSNAQYAIHNCDITNTQKVNSAITNDLFRLQANGIDLIMSHPPYLDIIKFTDKKEDLSSISDLSSFVGLYMKGVVNVWPFLKINQYFVLVIGDLWRNGEVIPLGFYLMDAIRRTFNCLLKGIVVKDIEGNRGKLSSENIWRQRTLKSDNFLFKHEYIFVFKKI